MNFKNQLNPMMMGLAGMLQQQKAKHNPFMDMMMSPLAQERNWAPRFQDNQWMAFAPWMKQQMGMFGFPKPLARQDEELG